MSSSVVVVEIDTRKGPFQTLFESSVENQTEQGKQFWKTLTLSPHIESSLYSKEILQQIKTNTLKEISNLNSLLFYILFYLQQAEISFYLKLLITVGNQLKPIQVN